MSPRIKNENVDLNGISMVWFYRTIAINIDISKGKRNYEYWPPNMKNFGWNFKE